MAEAREAGKGGGMPGGVCTLIVETSDFNAMTSTTGMEEEEG